MSDYKNYTVEITETLCKCIVVKASSKEHAISVARIMYNAEDIVLNENDYNNVDFKVIDSDVPRVIALGNNRPHGEVDNQPPNP
jgi:hypothetical protein